MKTSPHNIHISCTRKLSSFSLIWIVLILGLSSSYLNAQYINWEWWTNYWFSPWYGINTPESLVIGPSGDIYTTGYLANDNFNGGTAFVAKFNSAGEENWNKEFGETMGAITYAKSIAIDDAGNIYTMGTFEETRDFDPGSGTENLTSAGSADIYILKLNSSGDFVWAKRIGGTLQDGTFRSCLAINPENGQLYLAGHFNGLADFDPGPGSYSLTSQGSDDIFITSLDASGNFLWADRIGGSGSDVAKSIARDDNGDILTTGKFTGNNVDFNPGSGSFFLNGGGTFISKLTGDGSFSFALRIGNETGTGNAVAIDAENNIYTTGPFSGTGDFDPGPGVQDLEADGTDFYISKLDESGNFIWAVQMTGIGYAEANSIAVDNAGNVYTVGRLSSIADFDPGPGQKWITAVDAMDIFVSKLDASGNYVFAESGSGDDWSWWDSGNYIAVDNAGSAYITGEWANVLLIGPYEFYDGIGGGGTWSYVAKFGTEVVPPLSVSITGSNVPCHGESTGSATAQFSGGFSPYDYDWSNGQSGAQITDLVVGVYTVTVTDNNDNTATAQVVITEPPLLEFSNPIISNVSCYSGSDGSIQANGTGGVPPYMFEWSNGETGPFIDDLEIGVYTVTITDHNDCTQSESYQVDQPDPLAISLVNINDETCSGSNDGGITIDISGGTNPLNAIWSNGNAGTTNTNLAPGIYSVTITDNNDCTQSADYTILPGSFMEINLLLIHHVSCSGGSDGSVSVTGSSGIPPYVYQWSNGETGSSIDTLTPGLYSLTTTDSYGCFSTAEYLVNEPSAITAQITQTSQNLCAGDNTAGLSAIASGGTSPLAALWSNGISGFENQNLGAGIYSVTITDANACTSLLSDTITEPLPINVNVAGTNETNAGANDGTAMSNPTGGIPPFNFLWNNDDTLSTLSGLSPGAYTVTITDANGCTAEGTALVNAFGCTLDIIPITDVTICAEDSVAIQPTVMGGTGVFSYLWSDGSTGESFSVYQTGEYCVTISDESNCQDLDCVVVNEIIIPHFTCPVIDESVPGANDGSVQCDNLPGIISYQWSNDSTSSSIDGLPPGQYCVTVTDINGCLATQCFYVQPANCQLSLNVSLNNIKCAGDSTGSILLTTNNGTNPISYTWSNGATTNEITNLSSGNYAVTVSDASGCVELNSFTISEPDPLTVKIDSIAPAGPSGSGLLAITVSGGTPPYTYQWTDSLGKIIYEEDLDSLVQPGFYTLILLDKNSCVLFDTVYVPKEIIIGVDKAPVYDAIKVFPVPSKDMLFIDTDNIVAEVLISGVDGRVYKRIVAPDSNRLDIADLVPGWYILRIRIGNSWHLARVIK